MFNLIKFRKDFIVLTNEEMLSFERTLMARKTPVLNYENGLQFLQALRYLIITEEEYKILKKFFGHSNSHDLYPSILWESTIVAEQPMTEKQTISEPSNPNPGLRNSVLDIPFPEVSDYSSDWDAFVNDLGEDSDEELELEDPFGEAIEEETLPQSVNDTYFKGNQKLSVESIPQKSLGIDPYIHD